MRSLAVWATRDPSNACALADATPRLKTAGMIIPADTTNNPSFIIALRVSLIIIPLQLSWYSGDAIIRYIVPRTRPSGYLLPPVRVIGVPLLRPPGAVK